MSSWAERVRGLSLLAALAGAGLSAAAQGAAAAPPWQGIGRAATPAELRAWDIDVRPDFRGLPPGSGSVAKGQEVWEAKCASCHGVFGESNEIFSPIVGGTTAQDVKTGRAARLRDEGFPQRTSMMKLSTVSTLWDYIYRAMPWTQPKSLSTEEVYATTAFILNLAGVVPDDFVLSDKNIREVQARLPARDGKTVAHAMWPGRSLAGTIRTVDARGTLCMSNCTGATQVVSSIPDHARNAHGNLAEQNRLVGAVRGADTTRPVGQTRLAAGTAATSAAVAATGSAAAKPTSAASGAPDAQVQALLTKHLCLTCHGVANRVVGPSLREVAAKYASLSDAQAYLAARITAGSSGVWGAIPMPGQNLPPAELQAIVQWMATSAAR